MGAALAFGFGVFVWWASTGAILYAVRQPREAHGGLVLGAIPFAILAVFAFVMASNDPGVIGAWAGFAAAIVIWGWHELSFLTGMVTGPRPHGCAPSASGWRRFAMAFGALAWHELALAGTALGLWLLSGTENQTGLIAFLILFGARISAKLNLFLGVPNMTDDLMPQGIGHLRSYFRVKRMNPLFPISVLGLISVMGWLTALLWDAQTQGEQAGLALCLSLAILALVEHLLMVLPVRESVLWRWLLPRAEETEAGLGAAAAKDGLRAGL